MEINWENMQASMQIYSSSGMTVLQIWKILRKATAMKTDFSTVTGLLISLKQNPTKGVFVKTFQNFQNINIFYATPLDGYI